jgi:hypothetical protein
VPARNRVGDDRRVSVTKVWLGIHIINRCCRTELCHGSTLIV